MCWKFRYVHQNNKCLRNLLLQLAANQAFHHVFLSDQSHWNKLLAASPLFLLAFNYYYGLNSYHEILKWKKNHQGVDLKCCFSVDWKFSAEVAATPTKSNRQKSESPGKIIITIEKNHWYWTLGHHIKLRVWCMTVRMLQNAIRATSFCRPFNFLHHFLFTLYVSFNWLTLSKFCRAFKQLIKCSTLRWPSITTKHSFRFI